MENCPIKGENVDGYWISISLLLGEPNTYYVRPGFSSFKKNKVSGGNQKMSARKVATNNFYAFPFCCIISTIGLTAHKLKPTF